MPKLNTIQKTLLVSLMFLCGLLPAMAAEGAAILVVSRGAVSAETDGVERVLKQGDSVFEEDQVATGDKSFAVLQFIDGAKVTVRPNSILVIKEYVYNGGDDDVATLSLVEGGLRIITGALAKAEPESYKIETPVALMGVRGTEFAVVLCDDGNICEEEGAITD